MSATNPNDFEHFCAKIEEAKDNVVKEAKGIFDDPIFKFFFYGIGFIIFFLAMLGLL